MPGRGGRDLVRVRLSIRVRLRARVRVRGRVTGRGTQLYQLVGEVRSGGRARQLLWIGLGLELALALALTLAPTLILPLTLPLPLPPGELRLLGGERGTLAHQGACFRGRVRG